MKNNIIKGTAAPGSDTLLSTHIDLLLKLDRLMVAGHGDTDDADAIRDLMDVSWIQMPDDQRHLITQLSKDLLTLHLPSPIEHPADPMVLNQELAAELGNSREEEDYLGALALLTERAPEISADRAAAIRGICYDHLGLPDVALLFEEYAIQVTQNADFASRSAISFLQKLSMRGRTDESLERVEQLITGVPGLPPDFLILRADFQYDIALQKRGHARERALMAAVEFYNEATKGVQTSNQSRLIWGSESYCESKLSACWMLLGRNQEARSHADRAIQINPDDAFLYLHRGLLELGADFESAIADFQSAVGLGTTNYLPYYYLAYHAFNASNYSEAVSLAGAALQNCNDREAASRMHELTAIAMASKEDLIDGMADEIRRHFRMAMNLAPASRRILINLQVFEERVLQTSPAKNWQRPPVEDPYATAARFSMQANRFPTLINTN